MDFIRRRAKDVFPGGTVTATALASNIAFGAAVLGAQHVELTNDGDWWFVASEFDWLRTARDGDADRLALFRIIVPFPEQGPSSHRSEIYIAAFARRAYLVRDGEVCWLIGDRPTVLPHDAAVPPWCANVLAFNFT